MKKVFLVLFVLFALFFVACETEAETQIQNEDEKVNEIKEEVESADGNVKVTNEAVEITTEEGTIEVLEEDLNVEAYNETVIVDNENITVKTESDGDTVSVTIENKQGTTVDMGDAPEDITEWCVPGETFDYESEQGDIQSDIVGPTTFKDEEYCEAFGELKGEYIDIAYTYYFTYGGKKIWVVTEVAGQKTEVLVEN